MGRQPLQIDIQKAQRILNSLSPTQFPHEQALCHFVADEYNKLGSSQTTHSVIKSRIRNSIIILPFAMPRGKTGRSSTTPLTIEHKSKLAMGRQLKLNSEPASGDKIELWKRNMERKFADRPNQLANILKGNRKTSIKSNCEECMGGRENRKHDDPPLSEAIRGCGGTSCVFYPIRPYRLKGE